jgi:hypothetical protein
MNRRLITHFLLTLSLTVSSQVFLKNFQTNPEVSAYTYTTTKSDVQAVNESSLLAVQQTLSTETPRDEIGKKEPETKEIAQPASINKQVKPAVSLSRGGTGLAKPQQNTSEKPVEKKQPVKQPTAVNKAADKKQTAITSNIELLDWWKSGRSIFSVGTAAEVKDLYTGKTFMVKRTMGTNHADTEALTKKDTSIIKSIWGGFSWDRRPVILTIKGKRYAASMSAMPHSGLDSAPAYAVINNRSEGYGKGENLDVIKGNGMDGHFDIHFLNSTRHKDGQEDAEHQAAVLKATGK